MPNLYHDIIELARLELTTRFLFQEFGVADTELRQRAVRGWLPRSGAQPAHSVLPEYFTLILAYHPHDMLHNFRPSLNISLHASPLSSKLQRNAFASEKTIAVLNPHAAYLSALSFW